jgi:hypothetical protein
MRVCRKAADMGKGTHEEGRMMYRSIVLFGVVSSLLSWFHSGGICVHLLVSSLQAFYGFKCNEQLRSPEKAVQIDMQYVRHVSSS